MIQKKFKKTKNGKNTEKFNKDEERKRTQNMVQE